MKSLFTLLRRHVLTSLVIAVVLIGGGYYGYTKLKPTTATATQYASVEKVALGTVSSGISATGQIVAAHKLDLNVYKQTQRIQTVNVQNGGHVDAGQILLSFDKSNANASIQSSSVTEAQAALDLENARKNYTDPNTQIQTLKNDIASLNTSVAQAEQDKKTAYRDFLNANLIPEPANIATEGKARPIISGLYSGTAVGDYHIHVYTSAADSGYSYTVTGLENDTKDLLTSTPTALGASGLKILFGSSVHGEDDWTLTIPNTHAPEYVKNKEDYDKKISTLDSAIAGYQTTIASKEQSIKTLSQTDTSSYRDLNVAKAEAGLTAAQVQLSKNIKVSNEQDIVAPFAGTIEGLSNVVVGATPTGGTNDPIVLGTLVSDQFLVTFSLGAVDTAKVSVGQKVLVNVTSFPSAAPLTGSITEISSLPDSTGVAQYTVKALIQNDASSSIALREGLLANITIVQKEVNNVIRIPVSAVTFANRTASVDVIGTLTDAQKADFARIGVINSPTGVFPSYPVTVKLGVVGTFFAEVQSGLKEGDMIIVSKSDTIKTVVQQRGPGGPGGGGGGGQNRTQGTTQTSTQGGGTQSAPAATAPRAD